MNLVSFYIDNNVMMSEHSDLMKLLQWQRETWSEQGNDNLTS